MTYALNCTTSNQVTRRILLFRKIAHLCTRPTVQSIFRLPAREDSAMDLSTSLNIVRLDGIHTPAPFFSPTFKHTYTTYDHTPSSDEVIIPRLKDADVCITTRVPITEATLQACPKLKLIAVLAIGVDMLDLAACKKHGVVV
jgi:hypothetical protein